MVYKTHGVCSRAIELELDGETIKSVNFVGGCDGNTKGVARLVEGMSAQDAITRLEGITCGIRSTSCPDQAGKSTERSTE